MKRLIIFLLLFAAIKVAGQTTGYLRFDTVKIMKQNGTCELYIINATKDSLGLLTNVGGGLTRFIKPRVLNDSMFIVGLDTLTIVGTGGAATVNLDTVRNSSTITISPSGGGTDAVLPLVNFSADLAGLMSPADKNILDTLSANAFVQGGNTFGAEAQLGTTDLFDLSFRTKDSTRVTIDTSGRMNFNIRNNSNEGFSLRKREAGIGIPVPIFRPTTTNQVIALDIMPNGTPGEFSNNGRTWIDLCYEDVWNNNNAVRTARVGIRSDRVEFGSRNFGGTQLPLSLEINGTSKLWIAAVGNVGIKNTNPIAGLDINASIHFNLDSLNRAAAAGTRKILMVDTSDGFAYLVPDTVLGGGGGGVTDHGLLSGLTDDDHSQYALLAGRSGGQILIGGTGTTDDLTLRTTSGAGATGADMIFQVGNNGANEGMRLLNAGRLLVNKTTAELGSPYSIQTTGFISTQSGTSTSVMGVNGTAGVFGTTTNHYLGLWSNAVERIKINTDGTTQFGSTFTRLMFGGATTSFPALKRSSANLQVRLADDSDFGDLEVADEAYGSSWNASNEIPTKNAVYDAGFIQQLYGKSTSVSGTPVTLITIPTSTDSAYGLKITFTGSDQSVDGTVYKEYSAIVVNNSGTVTVESEGTDVSRDGGNPPTHTVDVSVSGTNILIQVTGDGLGATQRWTARCIVNSFQYK